MGSLTIHDSSLLEGDALGSVIGVSDALDAGTHETVTVTLFKGVPGADFDTQQLTESQTLIAMPHLDTNGNGTYDFVTSMGAEDGPYTEGGSAVVDDAEITVVKKEPKEQVEQEQKPRQFVATMCGQNEVPPVETDASGIQNIQNVVQAHIHLGGPEENGPIVAFLFQTDSPVSCKNGTLAEGTLRADDLIGPLKGTDLSALANEIVAGNTYVNIHTTQHPAGEIRGQIEQTGGDTHGHGENDDSGGEGSENETRSGSNY